MRDYDALLTELRHAQDNDGEATRLCLVNSLRSQGEVVLARALQNAHYMGDWDMILSRVLHLVEFAQMHTEMRR